MHLKLKKQALQRRYPKNVTVHRKLAIKETCLSFYKTNLESSNTYFMKKLFSFLAIIGIVLASNCSRIPENNDPIIGVWQKADRQEFSGSEKETSFSVWTFNDAYLGRYNLQLNQQETIKTDFRWTEEDNQYTISYPGTDLADQIVTLERTEKGETLQNLSGEIVAHRN